MQKQAGGALGKKSNSGTNGNGRRWYENGFKTMNNSPTDDADKDPGLLAGTIAALLFALVFGACFWTIMDATRPARPLLVTTHLVSR